MAVQTTVGIRTQSGQTSGVTRKRGIWIGLVIGLLALLAVLIISREPNYEGRTLRAWLRELARNGDVDDDSPSVRAIRHFGTNGLPILLAELRYKDSTPKKFLMKWYDWIGSKLESEPFEFTTESERREAAASALRLLGPDAASAIPELTANLSNSDLTPESAWVLAGLGEPGKDSLLQNTSSTNWIVRISCAHALHFFTNDSQVVSALQSLCADAHPEVRQTAARGLGILQSDPTTTVPLLMTLLGDADSRVQHAACYALGRFGTNAVPALPLLAPLLLQPSLEIVAGSALRQIGSTSLPTIITLLNYEEANTRAAAVRALAKVEGTNASTSALLPPLLNDPSPLVRRQVVLTLVNSQTYPSVWLSPLTEALKLESDEYTRQQLLSALHRFGETARPALPVLTNLISQTTGPEREDLLLTVAIIDPEAAKRLGATKDVLDAAQWLKSASGYPGVIRPPGTPPAPR